MDGLLFLNSLGLLLELLLIDHYENTKQIVPIILLVGVLTYSFILLAKQTSFYPIAFKRWMFLTILSGIMGLIFHAYGNYEFALEIYPQAEFKQLFIKTIKGATPLLAPGAMIGLGLLGLIRIHIDKLNK